MAQKTGGRIPITIIGLILSLIVPVLPLGRWGRDYSGLGKLVGGEVLWWVLAVVVLLYIAFVERRPFSSVGFRAPNWRDILAGVVAAVVAVVGMGLIYGLLFPVLHLQMNAAALKSIVHTPFWYRFILVTRAAFAEELLFRGYGLTRGQELTRSPVIAAIVSLAFFTYAHLSFWGPAQLIIAGWGGLVLTVLFLWRRNLWANMLAHWLTDGAGFLLT